MKTFIAVNDDVLSQRIMAATLRVVFVAPAVSKEISAALGTCFNRAHNVSITVILDPNEEAYRLGYGDREGLEQLQKLAKDNHIGLRAQHGLRIGLLVVDGDVLVWCPTPAAVEGTRAEDEPNGLEFSAGSHESRSSSIVEVIRNAIGSDDSDVPLQRAEVGQRAFTPEEISKTIEVLKQNPPAPFDLARKTRVFSSKFQFVEPELRGAAWTTREIRLSSLLLNPDVPDDLQDLFETKVRPFSTQADIAVDVPTIVQGQIAYTSTGEQIISPMTHGHRESVERALEALLKPHRGVWLANSASGQG
jgi:hypothetical protein